MKSTKMGGQFNRVLRNKVSHMILFALMLFMDSILGQDKGKPLPLFQSHEILNLSLEADFKKVTGNSDDSTTFPARLTLTDNDGAVRTLDVRVRSRGKTRREKDVCTFPPLRLEFSRKETINTPFEGQKALKLVTHCKNPDFNEQNVIVEYLIYRAYQLFTDSAFCVRPAIIDYIDTGKKGDTLRKFAFFIEKEKNLAERLNAIEIEGEKLHPNRTLPLQTCMMDMFQYMIGNTDYSIWELHNTILVVDSARTRPPVAIPYDFDWSGLVSSTYAEPHSLIGTSDVTERVYRGFKKDAPIVEHTIMVFRLKKPEIYALFQNYPLLEEKRKKKALNYLDGFFWTIDNERRVQTEFFERARIVHD